MSENQSTVLQRHLDRLHAGDPSARDELLEHAYASLQRLVARMLSQFPGVRRWEGADDVSNNAALRLWKSLEEVRPATARDFYRLAALQIRRELLDLARHYAGPQGIGARHESVAGAPDASRPAADPADSTHDPGRLAQWTEFHRQVDRLPDEEREVFDLLHYQDLPHAEAAQLLGISEATLRRRWLAARLKLQELMQQDMPG
jgi:RNA polymerase sigma-70 factor (ECF subfamily)